MLGREPPTILFSSEALQATLLRLQMSGKWFKPAVTDCDLSISGRRF